MSGSTASRDASSPDLPQGGFRPAHVVLPDLVPTGLHPDFEPKPRVPVGGFRPTQQALDWSAESDRSSVPVVSLRLLLGWDGNRFPPEGAIEIADLLRLLDEFDREAGGSGLALDRVASSSNAGAILLVLRPERPEGARERFDAMAELLGVTSTVAGSGEFGEGDVLDQVAEAYHSRGGAGSGSLSGPRRPVMQALRDRAGSAMWVAIEARVQVS